MIIVGKKEKKREGLNLGRCEVKSVRRMNN